MPSGDYFGDALLEAVEAGTVSEAVLDDKVLRILSPMLELGLFDHTTPSSFGSLKADVTSPEHRSLARGLAASSAVLLKNENGLLPLQLDGSSSSSNSSGSSGGSLVVVGDAAALGAIVGGGGSGSVVPSHVVSLLEGIFRRFGLDESSWNGEEGEDGGNRSRSDDDGGGGGGGNCTFKEGVDFYQENSPQVPFGLVSSFGECCEYCANTVGCNFWTFEELTHLCYLKETNQGYSQNNPGLVSGSAGVGDSQALLSSWVTYFTTEQVIGTNNSAALEAIGAADAVVVAVATTSGEGSDRATLSLSDDENELVATTAAAAAAWESAATFSAGGKSSSSGSNKVAVVVNSPGAVLLPWLNDVGAVLLNFLPGEQAGLGQADVLWGDVNPSARLPLTLPNEDNEVGFTEEQYPGVGPDSDHTFVSYSESLLIG
jgi:beta-glucosidase